MIVNNCPKCGIKANVVVIEKLGDHYVECPKCKLGGPTLFLGKEYKVVSDWNKYTNELKGK